MRNNGPSADETSVAEKLPGGRSTPSMPPKRIGAEMSWMRRSAATLCFTVVLLLTQTGCDLDLTDFRLLQIQEFADGPLLRIEDVNGELQIEFFGVEIVRDGDDE
jgi:hypothetical protein